MKIDKPAPTASTPGIVEIRRSVVIGLLVVGALALLTRFAFTFTESVNWDEFALLARAERALHQGQVLGGGRPGLVTLILVPFVRGCVDSVASVVHARVLWFLITVAYIGGVFALVRRWFRFAGRPENGTFEGLASAAMLAFLPAFVVWSVQVRTDQAALAAAVWGGLLLMSSGWLGAALSGVLFGLAILCSQKAFYVIGLCGLLWGTAMWAQIRQRPGANLRDPAFAAATRLAGVALSATAVVAVYAHFVPAAAALADKAVLASSWDVMNTYRARLGYRIYAAEIRQAPFHCVLFVAFAAMSARALVARDRKDYLLYATCWSVLLLGLAVVLIHGSNFRYFLMTAGLFPAVALGIASGQIVKRVTTIRTAVILLSLLALVLGSATKTLHMLYGGGQRIQSETMRWINSSGLRGFRGYQVEGALFCSGDPDPIPTMFSQQIARYSQSSPEVFEHLLDEFRRRPIAYIVDSYRMAKFPSTVKQFWYTHFVPYHGAVYVTGFHIAPGDDHSKVDVLVAGNYRWEPAAGFPPSRLRVGDHSVDPGGVTWLRAGPLIVTADPPRMPGKLVLAVVPPASNETAEFYDPHQVRSLVGID